jgi:GTP-binding protein
LKIHSAIFLTSNTDIKKCPDKNIPEYAFIGRSNVGKSSLINTLTGRKKLAKTSGTPGKTQHINHFIIDDSWYLVDLPGYGYARTSKKNREKFASFIKKYFLQRKQLACTFVLIDIRHNPQKIDLEFMKFLGENAIPFCMVFTKSDKIKPSQINQNIALYQRTMLENWEEMPTYFITSSVKGTGKEDILNFIEELNRELSE